MKDPFIEHFINTIGDADRSVSKIEPDILETYRDQLPDTLLEYWSLFGWNSFGNGLFWLVNPNEYKNLLAHWLEGSELKETDNYIVFARTAFGKLYLWDKHNKTDISLDTLHGYIFALDSDFRKSSDEELKIQSFFMIQTKEYLDMVDDSCKGLFDRAVQKIGVLDSDEIYAFEPALVLGGKAEVDNLVKVKLEPHLVMLRDMEAPALKIGSH